VKTEAKKSLSTSAFFHIPHENVSSFLLERAHIFPGLPRYLGFFKKIILIIITYLSYYMNWPLQTYGLGKKCCFIFQL